MEIDRKIVVESEDDAPQRITLAAFLDDEIVAALQHGPVALRHRDIVSRSPLTNEIMLATEIASAQPVCDALFDDALGNDPLWVDIHAIDIARQ